MIDDLKALFGIQDIENTHMPQRIRIAAVIFKTLEFPQNEVIQLCVPRDMAAEMAKDLAFAAAMFPFGVPDEHVPVMPDINQLHPNALVQRSPAQWFKPGDPDPFDNSPEPEKT